MKFVLAFACLVLVVAVVESRYSQHQNHAPHAQRKHSLHRKGHQLPSKAARKQLLGSLTGSLGGLLGGLLGGEGGLVNINLLNSRRKGLARKQFEHIDPGYFMEPIQSKQECHCDSQGIIRIIPTIKSHDKFKTLSMYKNIIPEKGKPATPSYITCNPVGCSIHNKGCYPGEPPAVLPPNGSEQQTDPPGEVTSPPITCFGDDCDSQFPTEEPPATDDLCEVYGICDPDYEVDPTEDPDLPIGPTDNPPAPCRDENDNIINTSAHTGTSRKTLGLLAARLFGLGKREVKTPHISVNYHSPPRVQSYPVPYYY